MLHILKSFYYNCLYKLKKKILEMGEQTLNFFLVRVEFESVNEQTGKPKKIKTQYLVDAMTCTEAEARTHQYLNGTVLDYEIVSAVKSPIEDVIRMEVTA